MATKRGAPDFNTDSRPHWKRQRRNTYGPKSFIPETPENHGKKSFKKAHATNPLRKTIRDLNRLLERDLPANIRIEKERQLQTATWDLENAEAARKRSEMIGKYHRIRFFDRQKAERRLKKARKALKEDEGDEDARKRVEEAEVGLNYALYAPLEWEYVSLFPTRRGEGRKEVERQGDREMWERVRVCMEEGTLGDLREGRLEGGGKVSEEDVIVKSKSVKKAKKMQKADSRASGKAQEEEKDEDESGDESGGGFFE